MALQVEGIQQIKLLLKRTEVLPDIADQELRLIAEEMLNTAKNMAPIDYGDLKGAIQLQRVSERGADGRFTKGKSNYIVYINGKHRVSDPEKIKHGVDTVGEYAWWVHEHMGWQDNPNDFFMPSNQSVAAGAQHGVQAGGKFIERAGLMIGNLVNGRLANVIRKRI